MSENQEVLATNEDQNGQYAVPDGIDPPSNMPSEHDGLNSAGQFKEKPEAEYFQESPDDGKSPVSNNNTSS
mgnify:CR=1 FL=1